MPLGWIFPYSSSTLYDALARATSVILPLMVTGVMVLFGDQISVVGLAVIVSRGAFVSFTVIVNVAVELLAAASFAVQVTAVVPMGKVEPDAGAHDTVAPTASAAVGVT